MRESACLLQRLHCSLYAVHTRVQFHLRDVARVAWGRRVGRRGDGLGLRGEGIERAGVTHLRAPVSDGNVKGGVSTARYQTDAPDREAANARNLSLVGAQKIQLSLQ